MGVQIHYTTLIFCYYKMNEGKNQIVTSWMDSVSTTSPPLPSTFPSLLTITTTYRLLDY